MPDKGGPAWYRLESTHFVLYTDQSEADARETLAQFESFLNAFAQHGWETKGALPVKLEALVFDDRDDFNLFTTRYDGYYNRRPPFAPLVVMPKTNFQDQWSTLKHELTHFIAYQALPFQPSWFAEGIASYFQTARFDDRGSFVVGDVPRALHRALTARGPMPARDLMAAERAEGDRFYPTSWLLVHYLMSERGEAFAKYQEALSAGVASNEAWAAAFPDLAIEHVDAALRRYFEAGSYASYSRPIHREQGTPASIRRLSSADVYALRARLYLNCDECGEDRKTQGEFNIQQALQLEPHHLNASALRYSILPEGERVPFTQDVARAHPDSWLSHWMLAAAELSSGPSPHRCSPEVVVKLRELGSRAAYALMMASTCQAAAGEKQDALELAERALRLQPADEPLLVLHAVVLNAARECDALQRLLPRLRNAVHARPNPKLLASLAACKPSEARVADPGVDTIAK